MDGDSFASRVDGRVGAPGCVRMRGWSRHNPTCRVQNVFEYSTCVCGTQYIHVPVSDDYTPSSVVDFLNEKLEYNLSTLRLDYCCREQKVEIWNCGSMPSHAVRVLFGSGHRWRDSLCRELGFTRDDVRVGPGERVRSPSRVDLSGPRALQVFSPHFLHTRCAGVVAAVDFTPPARFAPYHPDRPLMNVVEHGARAIDDLHLVLRHYDAVKRVSLPYQFNGMWWTLRLRVAVAERVLRPEPSVVVEYRRDIRDHRNSIRVAYQE